MHSSKVPGIQSGTEPPSPDLKSKIIDQFNWIMGLAVPSFSLLFFRLFCIEYCGVFPQVECSGLN